MFLVASKQTCLATKGRHHLGFIQIYRKLHLIQYNFTNLLSNDRLYLFESGIVAILAFIFLELLLTNLSSYSNRSGLQSTVKNVEGNRNEILTPWLEGNLGGGGQ